MERDSVLDRIASGAVGLAQADSGSGGPGSFLSGGHASNSSFGSDGGDLADHLRGAMRLMEAELQVAKQALTERREHVAQLKTSLVRAKKHTWASYFHVPILSIIQEWRGLTERRRHDTQLVLAEKKISERASQRTDRMRKVLSALGSHGSALEKAFQGWKISNNMMKPMDNAVASFEQAKVDARMKIEAHREQQKSLEKEIREKDRELIHLRAKLKEERASRREAEVKNSRDREVTAEAIALVRVMSANKQRQAAARVERVNRAAEVVRRAAEVYITDDGEFETRRITETLARCVAAYTHSGGASSSPPRTVYRAKAPEHPPLLPTRDQSPWRMRNALSPFAPFLDIEALEAQYLRQDGHQNVAMIGATSAPGPDWSPKALGVPGVLPSWGQPPTPSTAATPPRSAPMNPQVVAQPVQPLPSLSSLWWFGDSPPPAAACV
eukprot:gnl/MRDRNA2_/MRDRNA2_27930_c0_seq1.p1 gnl/MRDRNA2_/MRDRNA2_27930_c0~~gnl/MRDRNA2_/MRDRNA2_27930_c0_seq1.p1  ORF type:complete len:491 (+),score=98.04 gnl/MRDRNA2_/MRDRNA2_27930_c0_seq1:153-1475(+)